jgi:hypothetical protein
MTLPSSPGGFDAQSALKGDCTSSARAAACPADLSPRLGSICLAILPIACRARLIQSNDSEATAQPKAAELEGEDAMKSRRLIRPLAAEQMPRAYQFRALTAPDCCNAISARRRGQLWVYGPRGHVRRTSVHPLIPEAMPNTFGLCQFSTSPMAPLSDAAQNVRASARLDSGRVHGHSLVHAIPPQTSGRLECECWQRC